MDGLARVTGMGFIRRLLGSHEQQHPRTTRGARVLVVDDSATICAVLGKMLSSEGYQVLCATDGAAAIELAQNEKPALIFLDVVMPGMNGFRVLKKLRQDPLTADIPIVMISGNQQASEQFYLQRCGADDFMMKPFDRDDVAERIGKLVAADRLPVRETLAVGVEAITSVVADTELDQIPDIAMPDPGTVEAMDMSMPLQRKAGSRI